MDESVPVVAAISAPPAAPKVVAAKPTTAIVPPVGRTPSGERVCALEILTHAGKWAPYPASACKHFGLGLLKQAFQSVPFNWANCTMALYDHIDRQNSKAAENKVVVGQSKSPVKEGGGQPAAGDCKSDVCDSQQRKVLTMLPAPQQEYSSVAGLPRGKSRVHNSSNIRLYAFLGRDLFYIRR